MWQISFQASRVLCVLTVITGVAYPLVVTAVAQLVFPEQASGSLIRSGEKVLGSALIGQPFSDPKYFWSRPSATAPMPYNGGASAGSNQGPTNPVLKEAVEARVKALRDAGASTSQSVPVDLVTASASGLDPHISPAAAEYQIARIAKVRNMSEDAVRKLVAANTEARQFGIIGEPRVNVLKLNLALDKRLP
jgi:K+-transporting ATPase ATPase C chain